MKRLFTFVFAVAIMLLIPFTSEAAFKIVYDGKAHVYEAEPVHLFVNGERLEPAMPPIIFSGTTVVPARAVFEKMGAKVLWDPGTKQVYVSSASIKMTLKINSQDVDVDGHNEKIEIPAKVINGSTMIPLRFVSEKLGMKVGWNQASRTINIDNNKETEIEIKNVSVSSEGVRTLVKVEATGEITNYLKNEMSDSSTPFKVVIDIPSSIMSLEKLNIPVGDTRIDRIRASQYRESPKESRIVFDLAKKIEYNVNVSDDKKTLYLEFGSGDIVETELGKTDDFEELNKRLGNMNNVSIQKEDEKTGINIKINSLQSYKISRITDHDAIAIDINSSNFNEQIYRIPVNDKNIKYLEIRKLDAVTGRIVVGVEGQPQYQVFNEPENLSVIISEATYKNIKYLNSSDTSSSIIINKGSIKDKVTINEDIENKKFVISIPRETIELGTGVMYINDKMFDSLEIKQDSSEASEIILNDKNEGKLYFDINVDENEKTIINITTKDIDKNQPVKLPSDKYLVVIDAGHGGSDPGAKYDNVKEKDLNLDIAIRLNEILKDAGINTVMTRDKDVFVDLHERANIANRLKADLFVSIHNNAIDIPSYGGTMTLYYPSDKEINGLNGKKFAELVQAELMKSLGTVDRKIIPRPNLVVLNSTEMPAVLAEVGFITNVADRKKLTTAEFRQNAAKGLLNGVLRALSEIKK